MTAPWTDRVFLGRIVESLGNLIESQSTDLFLRVGLVIPVKSCSLMMAIRSLEPAAAVDLARHLDCSHQLVLQKIPKLLTLGLIDQQPSREDQRKNLFRLTDRGRQQLTLADALFPAIERAYAAMGEGATDIYAALQTTVAALQARPLVERVDLGRLPRPE